jgi:dUTPase
VKAELALDKLKAQSILDWEKPDSLYTLQSRQYSLNYWAKFIPSLAELKFPLNQILRSQIFSWDKNADRAWNRIKALIALDIRLTVPLQNEKLLVTTDASKIACSAILWVERNDTLRVVACHSKLFSHTDSLKSIYFKETYALISAFNHFRPYLLNTDHPVTVFTDARALIWVGRNREYSIACNSLANKLGQLQIEIPHTIYSVPSETNYLADIFSRSLNSSRFLEKRKFALSKLQANKIPPLTEPFVVDEATLYAYFTNTLNSEQSDVHPRNKQKISTPKPIKKLYKLFEDCTPEEKYYSAIRLLQGWNDPTIKPAVKLNATTLNENSDLTDKALALLETNSQPIFLQHCEQVINEVMNSTFQHLDPNQRERLKNTLDENSRKLFKQNLRDKLKSKFINHEVMLNNIRLTRSDQKGASSMEIVPSVLLTEPLADHKISYPSNNRNPQISGANPDESLPSPDPPAQPPASSIATNPFCDRAPQMKGATPVFYTNLPQVSCLPRNEHLSATIDLPLQSDLYLKPAETRVTDTGLQFYIPQGYYMHLIPSSSKYNINIHVHHGIIDNDFTNTIKLFIRNNDFECTDIPRGTFLVQGLITPVVHPHLNETESPHFLTCRTNPIELSHVPLSPLHALLAQRTPDMYTVSELNSNIIMPMENSANTDISYRISQFNNRCNQFNLWDQNPPLTAGHCAHAQIFDLTRAMVDRTAYLNTTQPSFNPSQHENHRDLKRQLHEELCKKMAVISVDLIKNQTITSNVLAKAQQGDDLLSTIRENIHTDQIRNQSYVLKNQVLYRTYCNPNNKIVKYALCVPDVLLPAVIHHLHILLGHATYSTMLKNFRAYYHAPMAQNLIKQYVAACTTCALANKYDIKKVVSSVERTIKSSRPRQHLYADLIPMYKGTFSYVLFALDTYSQFVYAIPLKDKTATSVLQGFLAIFGTTGWYENIYLDDETSFVKAAKMLTKVAPIQVHYSTPYCHFQNSSENYIKHFKKTFLKILNDHENPQENSDWPL